MLSRNQVKYVNSLRLKKNREKYGLFIAEGSKLVLDLLESDHRPTETFATDEWIRENASSVKNPDFHIVPVSEDELSRITALTTPGPVLAIFAIPETRFDPGSIPGKLVLALDRIRDPGNLGTIIRIADWFGIDAILCSETTVDLYNPKVVQATMGSIARVPVHYVNLPDFLSSIPGSVNIYGTFMDGENLYTADLRESGIILIGNESTGITEDVAGFVNLRLHIPSFPSMPGKESHAESLNASVATAVICSEFKRRVFK